MTEVGNKVVVVGAGLMGHGIAHAFASAGHRVTLVDIDAAALEKAKGKIDEIIAGGIKLGKVTLEAGEATRAALSTSTALAASAEGADLLIETATELLPVKLDILREVDPALPAHAIIGTNTSALSVTEIAGACADPARVVGMHFFNPVHKMKLLELVVGLATSPETLARARAYGEAVGKAVIAVNDSPGLTTSRMSAMLGNEAMWMLSEGVASAEDIDTALRLGFNHPMGPLELGDLTGWDTRLKVLQYLHGVLGDKFRPCPLILKMVKAGRIGRKAGAGVYRYDEEGRKIAGSGLKGSYL
ncbi:3-hydroxyacyl-CoA dehydrogenase [Novosphingobium album (ex Liu et al. 2023)]|uniref:3-hydroxyacyl-CoA dehydrogenase n=1 Tax=Novosphingobium album (ex Liu et al. 2023) TaxID=3031130 RepID=A0ABT5WX89_9SPHN|nr:3-hydroxyacyl-CoA dehydrogenase [Novosphingobium album (ex Liu et al. 2023)]MDE8654507.1 3-hydroxyacyl-CoA dehydrogenase [Novosphingobium album (ex Liu et al. 2023)]